MICGIEEKYIRDTRVVRTASVAARMSWASQRESTRPEDEAYCLMGLFDVNMPLLYGEGSFKAFRRLQHEIAEISEDESLFAWHVDSLDLQSGVFAPYPAAFHGCGDIEPISDIRIKRRPYSITNRGLSIDATYQGLPLESVHGHDLLGTYRPLHSEFILLPLKCVRSGYRPRTIGELRRSYARLITIILMSVSDDIFIRWLPSEVMVYEKYFRPEESCQHRLIYIRPPGQRVKSERWISESRQRLCVYSFPAAITPAHSTNSHGPEEWPEWYVTPPGFVGKAKPNSNRWSVNFCGWTGFAVLKIQGARAYHVIMRHVYDEKGNQTITLSLHDGLLELITVVDLCYAQGDLLDVIPHGSAVEWLQVDEDHSVMLTKRMGHRYVLEVTSS